MPEAVLGRYGRNIQASGAVVTWGGEPHRRCDWVNNAGSGHWLGRSRGGAPGILCVQAARPLSISIRR